MQLFPEKIIDLWNKCEVRVMILLSLILQIILIVFGNQRKLTARIWIRVIVWSAYLSADWVASVALGNLASSKGDSKSLTSTPNNALQEFWAPFLLLHLGGPDTITAYSLEDNELWLRHFLLLIIQVGVAFYFFLQSWGNTALIFISIPIFISGVIKYGERTYVLLSSSSKHFRNSLPSVPDSCQDFSKYIEQDWNGKRPEGLEEEMVGPQVGTKMQDDDLVVAYFLFTRSKYFFAERTLSMNEGKRIYSIIRNKSTAEAFKLVAVELGFMSDVLYTKATLVYSHLGIVLRCITFFCSVSALVFFSTVVDVHVYPLIDIYITYMLLTGAILLELYALVVLLSSDWTRLWLIKRKKAQHNCNPKTLVDPFWKFCGYFHSLSIGNKRWSESIGQYNVISSCLKNVQPTRIEVQRLPFLRKWLENKHLTRVDVNRDKLQEKILQYLKKQGDEVYKEDISYHERDLFLGQRGGAALKEFYKRRSMKAWYTLEVGYVDSLTIWHIATHICYYSDDRELDSNRKISKFLSEYMLYVLVICSSMLPKGIGEIRLKETRDEITELFKENRVDISSESKAYNLLQNCTPIEEDTPIAIDSDHPALSMNGSHSLLKFGCRLYRQLQEIDPERKWEIVSDVWVEMVVYAAHTCKWKEHAQQLRKGGELLTHICLLVSHCGLSKQYVHNIMLESTISTETETQVEPKHKDLELAQHLEHGSD